MKAICDYEWTGDGSNKRKNREAKGNSGTIQSLENKR